jgi:hypothetical protein
MSDTTLRKKRLVLFFDGTGNEIQSDTNVYRLYLNLAFQNNWLFQCLISASIHGHFRSIPHESALHSMN